MKPSKLMRCLHILIKGGIILASIYITILLGFLFVGKDIKKQVSSAVSSSVGRLATTLFCSNSNTLSYYLNDQDTLYDKLFSSSVTSPAIQYVKEQGSVPAASTVASDAIVIHATDTDKEPTAPTAGESLEASENQSADETLSSYDNIYFEDENDAQSVFATHTLSSSEKQTSTINNKMISSLVTNQDLGYLLENFYKINSSCVIDKKVWNVKKLLTKSVNIKKDSSEPQILIFHTHAHETFADSKSGVKSDSIVGVGEELASILRKKYGYNVMHYSKQYNYNTAYNEALVDLKRITKENPSIKVIIDMHRDGVDESSKVHTVCKVDGKTMAPIMFFNAVSNNKKSSLNYYTNPNLQENLAFSLQMKLFAMKTFPEFTKKTFVKSFRYNMHMAERYSLIEVGDNNNTVAEVKAAMEPLAEILDHVLSTPNEYKN